MSSFFSIKNLTYKINNQIFFKNFNLVIDKKKFTSLIASSGSGKSMLTKIISAIIPTTDKCVLNNISLNKETVLNYLPKIGIVTNDFNQDFLFKKVKDELAYPLENLGFPEHKINSKIDIASKYFKIENLLNKDIKDLTLSERKKLLIILALMHEPALLVLDDAFYGLTSNDQEFMLEKLKELTSRGLTILNITSKLDTIYKSDKVFILHEFKIKKEGTVKEIFEQDSYLRKIGLDIPFVVDVSLKLKFYDLISDIYFDISELEGALWK